MVKHNVRLKGYSMEQVQEILCGDNPCELTYATIGDVDRELIRDLLFPMLGRKVLMEMTSINLEQAVEACRFINNFYNKETMFVALLKDGEPFGLIKDCYDTIKKDRN